MAPTAPWSSDGSEPAFALEPLSGSCDPLSLNRRWPERYPFLLQSVAHGTAQSRFDILFAAAQESLCLDPQGVLFRDGVVQPDPDFLAALDRWAAEHPPLKRAAGLPFVGGWFVYLGYELAAQIESSLSMPLHPGPFPTAFAVRCPAAIVVDHGAGQALAVSEPEFRPWLEQMVKDWSACQSDQITPAPIRGTVQEDDPAAFLSALEAIHRYILDGDVFQVNLSRRWELNDTVSATDAYAALRTTNPAPFAAIARWQNGAVVSSSPERLVHASHGTVQTRPIAGTRPRCQRSVEEDERLREELIRHPKERAEHIMLIDLERNDLGRVCQPGSVEVDELMVVESYAHVHHIVSNVRGQLRSGVTPGDIIRAVFPGGTITGCPKVRCMEIIAELEQVGRGPYTGSLGYLDRSGALDLNILIRTLLVEPGSISFRAGAGIVADSVSERELEETRSKAKGLLLSLQEGTARAH